MEPIEKFHGEETLPTLVRTERCFLSTDMPGINNAAASSVYRGLLRGISDRLSVDQFNISETPSDLSQSIKYFEVVSPVLYQVYFQFNLWSLR